MNELIFTITKNLLILNCKANMELTAKMLNLQVALLLQRGRIMLRVCH